MGEGSTFTIRLPLSLAPENVQSFTAETNSSYSTSDAPLRILVVDDNIASAQTAGWMLELMGHVPTLAHDGHEALASAQKLQPDVIMLDIGLPGLNGYDVCRALREDSRFKDTLLIAQTGWGQERDRQLAREAGFDHHLVKPIKLEDISAILMAKKP